MQASSLSLESYAKIRVFEKLLHRAEHPKDPNDCAARSEFVQPRNFEPLLKGQGLLVDIMRDNAGRF